MSVENKQQQISPPSKFDLDAKWDACFDLGARRVVYSSLAGAFAALLLFRSPVTRWATVSFGAGIGIGSAYTECSYKFSDFSAKPATASKINDVPPSQELPDVA